MMICRIIALSLCSLFLVGCLTLETSTEPTLRWEEFPFEVTAYSSDAKSTGWEYNTKGIPVYAYGPMKGKPKIVGQTASGVIARKGTIAADTNRLPFGTWVYVPGYGYGRVEDRGGAIKGSRLDVYFPTKREAMRWGRQKLMCRVLISHLVPVPGRKMPYRKAKRKP